MAEQLTPQQKMAVHARGGRLLVSAAAGSGKTAVLTERIIRTLTDKEHPADITRLLVVTFTRAAAGELKAKTISFEGYVFAVGATTYYVSPVGGDVEVPVTTLVEYEIDIDASWLAYAQTKAVREETVVLTAAE